MLSRRFAPAIALAKTGRARMSMQWKSPAVATPSVEELSKFAKARGMNASDAELTELRAAMKGFLASFTRVEELKAPKLAVKYPRVPGHQVPESENELGAWYVKTSIKGAATGPLAGKRLALKDNVCVAGVQMMNGSRMLEGYTPDEDATIVTRLLDAGAEIAGKACCEDLCLSGGSHTSAKAPVRNPHDKTRHAGGSSGGSAALVASGEVDYSIACDQGGSIRIPACFCGVVGYKPTHGLLPYTGIISMDPTLDHIGPIARTVRGCADVAQVLAGKDGHDPRQADAPAPGTLDLTSNLPGDVAAAQRLLSSVKIGVLKEGFGFPQSEKDVDAKILESSEAMRKGGATVFDISVPYHLDGGHIWTAIGVDGLAVEQFVIGGAGPFLSKGHYIPSLSRAMQRGRAAKAADTASGTNKIFALLGAYMQEHFGGEYYGLGQNLSAELTRAYDQALEACDVFVMPCLPMVAPSLPTEDLSLADYVGHALAMIPNTAPINVSGHPAITVPAGLVRGLPVGVMFVGRKNDDARVLQIAAAYEAIRGPLALPAGYC